MFTSLENQIPSTLPQWKISYKKRNLLAKIDLSGKQKPICGIEGPLYQSSYTEVVLEMTKGVVQKFMPKVTPFPCKSYATCFFRRNLRVPHQLKK